MSDPAPVAVRVAKASLCWRLADLSTQAAEKAKLCLYDLIGCALEGHDKPWSRQAASIAARLPPGSHGAAIIIGTSQHSTLGDAAFVNAVMGHGLVREDMHAASISHLGVVVLPTLLALAQYRRVTGADLLAAVIVGYEAGAQVGRAVIDPELARVHRPTGITGPIAAAVGAAHLLGLNESQCVSAIALAANSTAGLNEWGYTGGSEMFFHPGTAARNGLTAALLAQAGAFGSPTALDGKAGLFASLGRAGAGAKLALFRGSPEILNVYHKPVAACNFAQTTCLAAQAIAREARVPAQRIVGIRIRVPHAAATYPGCDFVGPYRHALQAKMSIQFNVAAALLTARVDESNFKLLDDDRLHRLLACTALEIDPALTQAFPCKQGAEVTVIDTDGRRQTVRLEDVVHATADEVRTRFRAATENHLGRDTAERAEGFIDALEAQPNAGDLMPLLALRCHA